MKRKKKWFPVYSLLLPRFNRAEALLLSWIIDRITFYATQRQQALEEMGIKLEDIPKEKHKPIDNWYVCCTSAQIRKALPFMSVSFIEYVLHTLKKKNVLESKVIQKTDKYGKETNRRHVRVNWLQVESIRLSPMLECLRKEKINYDLLRYRAELKKIDTPFPYFQIQEKHIPHFDNCNQAVVFSWLFYECRDGASWIPLARMQRFLGLLEDKQRSILKELKEKGMIEIQIRQEHKRKRKRIINVHANFRKDTQKAHRDHSEKVDRNHSKKAHRDHSEKVDHDRHLDSHLENHRRGEAAGDNVQLSLFGEKPVKKEIIEAQWADQLRQAVTATRMRFTPFSRQKWVKEFQLLSKQLKTAKPEAVIENTLQWYCRNIKGKYVPVCDSAKSFRIKFDKIQDAMTRVADRVEISEETRTIYKTIKHLGWPKESQEALLSLIETSRDQYRKWLGMLASWKNIPESAKKSLSGFYIRIAGKLKRAERDFLRQWFTEVHERKKRIPKWDGTFNRDDGFHIDNPRFQTQGKQIALEYSRKEEHWTKLLELLSGE